MAEAQATTHVPQLCRKCLRKARKAGRGQHWLTVLVTVQIGVYQASLSDPTVWGRCTLLDDGRRDAADLSLVLAELGCLGCLKPKTLRWLLEKIRTHGVSRVASHVQQAPMWDQDAHGEAEGWAWLRCVHGHPVYMIRGEQDIQTEKVCQTCHEEGLAPSSKIPKPRR